MAGFLMNVGKSGEVAERSPAVISANMKEDMLLQRRMIVLNRSERSLVHQIKVDQKVLYKRFQSRLVRSRLGFARIMGQKGVEKELRTKTIGALNTDIVGSAEEDYGFLAKLEQRPCTANCYKPEIVQPKAPTRPRIKKPTSARKQQLRPILNERPASAERPGDREATIKRPSTLRPATTSGTRVAREYFKHKYNVEQLEHEPSQQDDESDVLSEKHQDQASQETESIASKASEEIQDNGNTDIDTVDGGIHGNTDTGEKSVDGNDEENQNDAKDSSEFENGSEQNVPSKLQVKFLDELARPRTVAGGNSVDSQEDLPTTPTTFPRRSSKSADFFVEERKVDLLTLRLKEARAKNYTSDVKKFCEELENLKCTRMDPHADYYTIRLQASVKQGLTDEISNVPGTPDEENRRCIGNLSVRSLTLTELNWDFN